MSRVLKYASDLHLECRGIYDNVISDFWTNSNNKQYLALVGDIGNLTNNNLERFFSKIAGKYKKIYYVPGNHEFWHKTKCYHEIEHELKKMCNYHDIIYMNNKKVHINDYQIIGTTLWSNVTDTNNLSGDYKNINYQGEKITPEITNEFNKNSIKFISENLNNDKSIILSHHAPLFKNCLKYEHIYDLKNQNYCNNLKYLLKDPIKYWIFGHTHYSTNFYFNNVNIRANQLGFVKPNIYYDPKASITLRKK